MGRVWGEVYVAFGTFVGVVGLETLIKMNQLNEAYLAHALQINATVADAANKLAVNYAPAWVPLVLLPASAGLIARGLYEIIQASREDSGKTNDKIITVVNKR